MNCESFQARMVEWQAGELDADTADSLATHIRECDECREAHERLARLWLELGTLPNPAPPEGAVPAFRAALPHLAARPWPSRLQAAAVLAALLLGGAVGYTASPRSSVPPADRPRESAQPATTLPQFLLLLQDATPGTAPPPDQLAAIVREYGEWAARLRGEGRLVSAEKLADEPGFHVAQGVAPAANASTAFGGFFIVHARDYAEAAEIANASPHLKYGGSIDIRRIDPT